MAPAWSFKPTTSAAPPPPPDLFRLGQVLWLKGADSWIPGTGPLAGRIVGATDLSTAGQDFETDTNFEPLSTGATIDGVDCVSYGFNLGYYLIRDGALKDRNGVNMGYADGDNQAKSIYIVARSTTGVFSITGGPLYSMTDIHGPRFECLFDLEGNFGDPDAFYLWSSEWRSNTNKIRGPDTPGSTFDDVASMLEWRSDAFPNITIARNGTDIAITPSSMPGSIGGDHVARTLVGNIDVDGFGLNFSVDIAEVIVYDYDTATIPAARQAILQYLADTYPTIPIVVP